MKQDKKHIDRLFQEKFKHFEASPHTDLWKNIEAKLDENSDKKPIPIWWNITRIAATIVFVLAMIGLYQSNIFEYNPIVDDTENKLPEIIEENSLITFDETDKTSEANSENNSLVSNSAPKSVEEKTEKINSLVTTFEKNSSKEKASSEVIFQSTDKKIEFEQTFSVEENSNDVFAKNTGFAEQEVELQKDRKLTPEEDHNLASIENAKKELLGEEVSDANEYVIPEVVNERNISQAWGVKPLISPIFNLASGSGAAIDPILSSNNSQGNTSLSYGVLVTYQVTPSIRVRSGIHQMGTSYATNDIVLAPVSSSLGANNQVLFDPNFSGFNIYNESYYNTNVSDPSMRALTSEGNLQQQLGFIEVPMEVEWELLEGKFGIYASGGASTLFLMNNRLGVQTNETTINIGENAAANSTSFSGNIGLGLDYQLTRRFNLNLEPSFRYQFNTFSSQINGFTPYFFAIYTGVNFKF